jgi:Flp pilus assembly protein TadG
MKRFLEGSIGRIARDRRGVSMIEFGLLAPVVAVLMGAMIDLSMGLSHVFSLQQSVSRSLEMVQANRPQKAATASDVDFTYLTDEVAKAAGVPTSKVVITKWLECNGVKQSSYNGSCADGADTARYVDLKVTKDYVGKMYLKTFPVSANAAVRIQ